MKRFWADLSDIFVEKERAYLVCNDQAQFFSGLRGGKPVFSESYDDARPLQRESQFRNLDRDRDWETT